MNLTPSSALPANADDIFYLYHRIDPTQRNYSPFGTISSRCLMTHYKFNDSRMLLFLKSPDFVMYVKCMALKGWAKALVYENNTAFAIVGFCYERKKGAELRRISAVPSAVLDVIVGGPSTDMEKESSRVAVQEPLTPTPQTREEDMGRESANSIIVTSDTNTRARLDPAYGLEEVAMNNYRKNDNSAFHPAPRAPQFISDAETPARDSEPDFTKDSMDHEQILTTATIGDRAAQVTLGDKYRGGEGVDQDYRTVMDWYLKAAAQGNLDAQYNIGVLYEDGRGVPRDYTQAMAWYLKAANQDNADIQNGTGS
ncbi:hypothetical protein BGZ95_005456, partial [Linnemannia exigua]